MGYRKLNIDGKQYEYVIGKVNTKVRIDGKSTIYNNSEIGNLAGVSDHIVTPLNVEHAILSLGLPKFTCKEHGVITTNLRVDPFEEEINQKIVYMIDCLECYNQCAAGI